MLRKVVTLMDNPKVKRKRYFSVRSRTLLTVVLLLAIFIAVFFYIFMNKISYILLRTEEGYLVQQSSILSAVVENSLVDLKRITRDWAIWDNTYAYASGEYPDYIRKHVAGTSLMSRYRLSVLAVMDLEGKALYTSFFDTETNRSIPEPEGFRDFLAPYVQAALQVHKPDSEAPQSDIGNDGFVIYQDKAYYLCVMPIQPSNEKSSPAGALFFGRTLGKEELTRLSRMENMSFSIKKIENTEISNSEAERSSFGLIEPARWELQDISTLPVENRAKLLAEGRTLLKKQENDLTFFKPLRGLNGRHELVLSMSRYRLLYDMGQELLENSAFILLTVILLFIVVLYYLLEWQLIKPLVRLSSNVKTVATVRTRVDTSLYEGREFHTLAACINGMLHRLEESMRNAASSKVSLSVLKSTLNGFDGYLYVYDPIPGKVLFLNEKMKDYMSATVQNLEEFIMKVPFGRSDDVKSLEADFSDRAKVTYAYEPETGRHFKDTSRVISWIEDKKVILHIRYDITEIKAVEKELIGARETAVKASRAKSDFLSRMSHEIRTPMNAIIGMTNIALDSSDMERKEYCLARIKSASKHLLGIINDILDMSKIEADKLTLSPHPFKLEEVLKKISDVVNFRAEEKGVTFHIKVEEGFPRKLIGDEQRFMQVVTNFIANAFKFTPNKGTVKLTVRKTEETDLTLTVRVEVSDTGIGIPKERQPHLFKSFEQVDETISRRFGGSGLGLAISKRIVELMSGEIGLESEEGRGSTFFFTCRFEKDTRTFGARPPLEISRDDLRIMVMEDSAETRDYFAQAMTLFDLHCDIAAESGAGFEQIARSLLDKPYSIFFIDRAVPPTNGVEVAKKIRQMCGNHVFIVMTSSSPSSERERKVVEAEVDFFITKPLFPSVIMNCINECLGISDFDREALGEEMLKKSTHFKKHRILVAEDIEINQEIIEALLEKTGIGIDFASTGTEVLERFKNAPKRYSLILMDVHMPEMDGLEATQALRSLEYEEAQKIPIIAMTASVFKEDIEQCKSAGMNDHIGKPIDIDEFFGKLYRYLTERI